MVARKAGMIDQESPAPWDLEDTDDNSEESPLIPKDTYEIKYCSHEVGYYFGKAEKLKIVWQIVMPIKYAGLKIPSYCNYAYKKFPKPSKYWSWWVVANGNRKPERTEKSRMSPQIFKDKVFEACIETVKPKFRNGKVKPDVFHYSQVTDLLSITIGKDEPPI